MARFSFPKQARIRYERDFRRVYRRGRRLEAYPLRLCALQREEGGSRLGMAISRKVGGSVVRARWRRAIREAFRLNRHVLRAPYDLVVSVAWEARPEEASCVQEAFLRLVDQLNGSGPSRRPADAGP